MRRPAFRPGWVITTIAVLVVGLLALAWWVPSVRFPTLLMAGGVAFVALVAACVLVVPDWLVARDTNPGRLGAEQLATAKNDIRTALIQLVVGLAAIGGIAVAWQQLQSDRAQLRTDQQHLRIDQQHLQEQLTVARQGQVAERFTRAVEQLGSAKVGVRLGGIYGLEQIAKQSPGDRLQIFEVLCAYVREHARKDPKRPQPVELQERALDLDVEAAITVLVRRAVSADDPALDLHGVDLSGSANLQGANLLKANFRGAYLRGARLDRANLQGADPQGADLREAFLTSAKMQGASLYDAKLQEAYLNDTKLQEADLEGANLKGAYTDSDATKWPDGFDWRAAGVREMGMP
jgi:Pentapeptide repeats (8 copies)